MALLGIVQRADGFFEELFEVAPAIDLMCDLRLELALSFRQLSGGLEPFVFGARARGFDGRIGLGELARESFDVRGSCRLILTGALDLECRGAQLLVNHLPRGRGPGHADLVLGLDLRQLTVSGRDGGLMALLRFLESRRGAGELLLEIDLRRSLDRARDDDRQIAEQGLILLNAEVDVGVGFESRPGR